MDKKNKNHYRKKKNSAKVSNPIENKTEAKDKNKPTIGTFSGISDGLGIVDYSLRIPSNIEGILKANQQVSSLFDMNDKFAGMSKFSTILNAHDNYSSIFQTNNLLSGLIFPFAPLFSRQIWLLTTHCLGREIHQEMFSFH